MENIVITIGREYGSKGREIGEKLAAELGFNFYDKKIIQLAAERSGMTEQILQKADETAGSSFFAPYYPPGIDAGNINDRVFKVQSDIIREKARTESCVIVGRCANYVLADEPNCLRVYIYADLDTRISNIMASQGIQDRELASRVVKKNDKTRRAYYQYYTDWKWGGAEGYDLLINSKTMGIDGIVELLKQQVEIMKKK
ncbi:MAG: cytidylate kinase-like family protein [Peptococcaceae bacterium]|nr:cytidylate kinase-like family protein [Peptococcaceae bacterium]